WWRGCQRDAPPSLPPSRRPVRAEKGTFLLHRRLLRSAATWGDARTAPVSFEYLAGGLGTAGGVRGKISTRLLEHFPLKAAVPPLEQQPQAHRLTSILLGTAGAKAFRILEGRRWACGCSIRSTALAFTRSPLSRSWFPGSRPGPAPARKAAAAST